MQHTSAPAAKSRWHSGVAAASRATIASSIPSTNIENFSGGHNDGRRVFVVVVVFGRVALLTRRTATRRARTCDPRRPARAASPRATPARALTVSRAPEAWCEACSYGLYAHNSASGITRQGHERRDAARRRCRRRREAWRLQYQDDRRLYLPPHWQRDPPASYAETARPSAARKPDLCPDFGQRNSPHCRMG